LDWVQLYRAITPHFLCSKWHCTYTVHYTNDIFIPHSSTVPVTTHWPHNFIKLWSYCTSIQSLVYSGQLLCTTCTQSLNTVLFWLKILWGVTRPHNCFHYANTISHYGMYKALRDWYDGRGFHHACIMWQSPYWRRLVKKDLL
jgi:hypothetical protein